MSRLGKAVIVLGPRQTGKTTLLTQIAEELGEYLFLNADDPLIRQQLEGANTETLKRIVGTYEVVFVDEAQRIKNIGLTLKLITDQFPSVQLLVSGSSSLELASEINEPLTGRKWEYRLFPISWAELSHQQGYLKSLQSLETRLLYGMYPEVITNTGNEQAVLQQLSDSYLYKDLLSYEGIRKPELIQRLLRALAFQVGNEVSYSELARTIGANKRTVSAYIDLLEKAFVIFRLPPFSRNLRSEINSGRKIYFLDNGIRNALIANFRPVAMREDIGALWENFLVSERKKYLHYQEIPANMFFWRTKNQQEIDYLEERDGHLYAYEFKWNPKKRVRWPSSFRQAYANAKLQPPVNQENFTDFLLEKE